MLLLSYPWRESYKDKFDGTLLYVVRGFRGILPSDTKKILEVFAQSSQVLLLSVKTPFPSAYRS